jgi:hypothetical protein
VPEDDSRDHAIGEGRKKSLLALLLDSEVDNIRRRRPMRFGASCLVVARVP